MLDLTIRILAENDGISIAAIPGFTNGTKEEILVASNLQQVIDLWLKSIQKGNHHSTFIESNQRGGVVEELTKQMFEKMETKI